MRRIVLATLLFALLALPSLAHAQIVTAYATVSPAHLSNVQTGAVFSATGYQIQTASYLATGFGGGVTLNFLPVGPVRLGFDMRGSTRPGTPGADSLLGGIKLSVHVPLIPIKPYVQASGGYLQSRTTNTTTPSGQTTGSVGGTFTNKYAIYEILGGIDYPVFGPLDIRLIEVGGGQGIGVGSYSPTFITINTGLTVHF